jgi:RNA polymerase sigma-70 factor (ECF subfamily)
MDEEAALRVEDLLARSEWIRSLAASLARDPDAGEDLAQSTIAIALEKQPGAGVPPRRWLAAVMRNVLRQDLRSARRRERRERRAARSEIVASDVELLERLEIQRKVVDAVRALDEPYRSSILRRYFEGLTPTEIAQQTNVPLRTVHSRLNRGLLLLRQKLDGEFGDRNAWLGLLLPLVRGGSGGLGAGGGILMSVKVLSGVCAAIVLTLVVWNLAGRNAHSSSPELHPTTSESLAVSLDPANAPSARPPDSRESITATSPPIALGDTKTIASAAEIHEGRVLDVGGRPVAGVGIYTGGLGEAIEEGVRPRSTLSVGGSKGGGMLTFSGETPTPSRTRRRNLESSTPIAVSDAEGRFTIGHQQRGTLIHARGDGLVPALAFCVDETEPRAGEMILLVAEPSVVAGVVVGDRGQPIAGAELFVRVPESARDIPGVILDGAEILETYGHSGVGGVFQIPLAPKIEGRTLFARRGKFGQSRDVQQELSADSETGLVIDLSTETKIAVPVRGVVLDERGQPVPDARVGFDLPSASTDASGRFLVDAKGIQAGTEIVAAAPLFVPARVPFDPGKTEYEIRFGPRSKVLAGLIVDAGGNPMRHANVRITDPTITGRSTLEDVATNGLSGPGTQCDTEADGHFTLGGLLDRSYELEVADPETLRSVRAGPFEAGRQDVEIRFTPDTRTGRVAGRVVDRSGAPVPRAPVSLSREFATNRGTITRNLHESTDDTGVFEFKDVPLDVSKIRFGIERELLVDHALLPGEDLEHLVLVASRRAHFRIDRSESSVEADSFQLLDASGNRMPILKAEGRVSQSGMKWPITGSLTGILSSAEAAETLVLERNSVEVARIPIRIIPGKLTILRP